MRDPIQYGDVLSEHLAVIEHERRHVTFRINGAKIRAGRRSLGVNVDGLSLKVQPGLDQCDVIGQAAGAARQSVRPGRAWLLDSGAVSLTPDDVRHAAALAHIGLEPEELESLARDLAGILDHVGRIASLDLADVPPTSHALDLVNVLGDDVPRPPWPRPV